MKAVVKEKQKELKPKYPYLGIRKDEEDYTVVLFTSCDEGTVVASDYNKQPIGYYSNGWRQSDFTPFTGTIELSND